MSFWAAIIAIFRKRRSESASAVPPEPVRSRPTGSERTFVVYRATSVEEWEKFRSYSPGLAAAYCPDDGVYADAPLVAFNFDAWPEKCANGLYWLDEVLYRARIQDKREARPEGRLIEDFVLHEVAGHHFQKVGADHKSPNTLMQDKNGPKTEEDRQELRDVLVKNIDTFTVKPGIPIPQPKPKKRRRR